MRLVEQSDVFVENLKMSTLHQIGIHESQLLDRNPRTARAAASRPPASRVTTRTTPGSARSSTA